MSWHYLDSQGSEFGPFDGQRMRNWYEQGYFSVAGDGLLVRLSEWKAHRPLSELYGGDRTQYFLAQPRGGEGGAGGSSGRERSRSPRHQDAAPPAACAAQPAAAPAAAFGADGRDWYRQPAPPAAGYPYGHVAPGWGAGYPGAPPPGPWGSMPPMHHVPPGPWGAPPPGPWGMPPPGHRPPYGWPPPMMPPGPYGWPPPPHGHPVLADYRRGDDRDRSRSRGRNSGGDRGRRRSNSVDEKSRKLEEEEEQWRRLGREGQRELLKENVASLYKDRIKPLANYVKGRLKERSSPEAAVRRCFDLYRDHPDLFRVEQGETPEEGAVYLAKDPEWFKGWVDIETSDDPYEESMWSAFKLFLDDGHAFAGGRYGMARDLAARNLDFLSKYTLGEICHIVQLAIQQRKIIAYHKKMLKPMQTTLAQPAAGAGGNSGQGSDLEEISSLTELVRVLFKCLRKSPSGIRLDRMKQIIKEEWSLRLNEMSFKCTKLTELLKQEPLATAFALDTDGKAFFVRAADPRNFTEEVRRIHAEVQTGDDRR